MGKLELESSPDFQSVEAVYFRSKSYFEPWNSKESKQKGVQSQIKHTSEEYKKMFRKKQDCLWR